jgi:hypothetical protein
VQDRWLSGFSKVTADGQVWVDPDVRAFNTADINVEYKFGRDAPPRPMSRCRT